MILKPNFVSRETLLSENKRDMFHVKHISLCAFLLFVQFLSMHLSISRFFACFYVCAMSINTESTKFMLEINLNRLIFSKKLANVDS